LAEAKKRSGAGGLPCPQRSVVRRAVGFRDVVAPAACSRDPAQMPADLPRLFAARPAARQFANTTTRELSRTKLYEPPRTEWIR